jgi:MerR family mercuric resistance operon transcriptional regulator
MQDSDLTIAGVARGAGVGVETVRYYERRGLVPRPARAMGSIRRYGRTHVHRIRFIKRAQELGFTLDEIESLLRLEDGAERRSIRRVATARLEEIRARIRDLKRMERVLAHLIRECETHGAAPRCPIIGAIAPGAEP